MKRFLFMAGIAVLFTAPLLAEPTVHFTTPVGTDTWTLTKTGPIVQLSFTIDSEQVDYTVPAPSDSVLTSDLVNMPTMALTGIIGVPDTFATALLVPSPGQLLTIKAQGGALSGSTVFSALVGTGATLDVGPTYLAFPEVRNDLTVVGFTPGYSTVLTALVTAPVRDLYFSGTADNSINLPDVILGLAQPAGTPYAGQIVTTVQGNFSGSINAINVIPAPGALLLAGLGTTVVGWLRRKKLV